MLKLITGRAKSGKTSSIMEEIRSLVLAGKKNIVLLVPEQYSHEAETELLRVCGDSLSLCGEVLSFTRLAGLIESELGPRPGKPLDKGGRLLCMVLALEAVGSRLRIYGSARRQSQLQDELLSAVDELKSCCISPEMLEECAASQAGTLGDKLRDMALIYGAYEAITAQGHLDPMDRLSRLAEDIPRSRLAKGRFYLDGFTDFTAQELKVIESLLRSGADMCVCLTCEGFEEGHEIFQASRRAALALRRLAGRLGVQFEHESRQTSGSGPMAAIERELFSFAPVSFDGGGSVKLQTASCMSAECEAAAARCIELIQDRGCRWRDIAVAVRGFEDYRACLESAFARYGVPVYAAAKSSLGEKPLYALISGAFEIISSGWDTEDVLAYLKTGLTGLSREEQDLMEDYIFTWSIRGSDWTREHPWSMHPGGYNVPFTSETRELLGRIDSLRRRLSGPLLNLQQAARTGSTAIGHARALSRFFGELGLPELLSARSRELMSLGFEKQAAEYVQLWGMAVSSLEQCAGMLGDTQMDMERFGRLYCLVLSKYDVGTIPLTVDRVLAGDMDRMRRRSIKHLIILGCSSSRLPMLQDGGSIFSDSDRELMAGAGLDIGGDGDDRLCHEFALIYNCFTLPSETLCASFCRSGDESAAQPSFVFTRLEQLFGEEARDCDLPLCRLCAPAPALELAVQEGPGSAAFEYLRSLGMEQRLTRLRSAALAPRGRLSAGAVKALYGEQLRLSASRIDKFASCPFAYFMQYGLRLKSRKAAAFSPPEMGSFMHYILENAAADIQALGGFDSVSREQTDAVCDKYVDIYIHERLNDFQDKSPRFIHLFRRLCRSVRQIVADMASELACSDFRPLDFELDFGDRTQFPPAELGSSGESLILTGIADRVDGWIHDGRLYVRVVDYKTGYKSFSLSDVWYGMGLQMLLYLFALQRGGSQRYGMDIVPAGVMYIPARDVLLSARAKISGQQILSEKAKALRRSGLLLDDSAVLQAMERGESPRYIPVSFKKGVYSGDALASAQRLGELSRHVDSVLRSMASQLHSGSIDASPASRTQQDSACQFCEFKASCRFDSQRDRRRWLSRLKPAQVWEMLDKKEGAGNEA